MFGNLFEHTIIYNGTNLCVTIIMRHAEKYTIDNISQTVVSPNDGSCSGTTKEDIPVPTR